MGLLGMEEKMLQRLEHSCLITPGLAQGEKLKKVTQGDPDNMCPKNPMQNPVSGRKETCPVRLCVVAVCVYSWLEIEHHIPWHGYRYYFTGMGDGKFG